MSQVLCFSGLSKTTRDKTIRRSFTGVTSVVLAVDNAGKYRQYALVTFSTAEHLLAAMERCGELICGKPLIVSTIEQGPFYLLVRGLSPSVKQSDVENHFKSLDVAARPPLVYLPMAKNLTKGFCFVYVASADHYAECLQLDHSFLDGKKISVLPGLFPCGRGRKRV